MTNNQTLPGMDEYRDTLDDLHFSESAKARMAKRLAREALAEHQSQDDRRAAPVTPLKPARRRRLSLAAAVAAIALVLGIGGVAYATGGLVSVQRFVRHLFGAQEPKVEIVDKVGHPVGVAQSVGGVTVSADAIIGDKTNIAVVFSVSRDDGEPFDFETIDNGLIPLGFSDHIEISLPLFSAYGATGSSYFYDADPADNAIQLVETRTYESDGPSEISLVGQMLTARFADLTYYGEDGSRTVIAPGTWDLSFPLDYEDTTRILEAGQAMEVNGRPATIDHLSISPIALHVAYTVDQRVEWTSGESGQLSEHDSTLMDSLLGIEARVTLKDGTILDEMSSTGGQVDSGEVAACETGLFFDRILDLDEVASITIGGTTIGL